MPINLATQQHIAIIDSLASHGYAVLPQFISEARTNLLSTQAKWLQHSGFLHPANTGKHTQLNATSRGDATYWVNEDSENFAELYYFEVMKALQHQLNKALFLGLHTLESHFAIYPTGAFYKKHVDQFKNDALKSDGLRQVSCILYLNEHWLADDGGELRLYLDEQDLSQTLDIAPLGGTLVAFMSARFHHEVLPAKRERISLTGWFKTRSNDLF
ncbi:MAG: 2OG-Fe(II) oxygenase [Methylotenera sp.]